MILTQIVTSAVRIVAIIAGLLWARDMAVLATLALNDELPRYYMPQLGVSLFWLASCASLWIFAQNIAKAITRFDGGRHEYVETPFNSRELEVTFMLVLGVYLLFNVASDLAFWLAKWFMYQRDHSLHVRFEVDDVAAVFATIVELLFALVLILRVRGISALLYRLRS